MKLMEWVMLVVAFNSALNLLSRPRTVPWFDRAPCLGLLTEAGVLENTCGSTIVTCCRVLDSAMVTADYYTFCACMLEGLDCTYDRLSCTTSYALMLVLLVSLIGLVFVFLGRKLWKLVVFPFYLGSVNAVYFFWTYGIPQCGDQDMVNQYFLNAIVLGSAFVIYLVMLFFFVVGTYGGEGKGMKIRGAGSLRLSRVESNKRLSRVVDGVKTNPGAQHSSGD